MTKPSTAFRSKGEVAAKTTQPVNKWLNKPPTMVIDLVPRPPSAIEAMAPIPKNPPQETAPVTETPRVVTPPSPRPDVAVSSKIVVPGPTVEKTMKQRTAQVVHSVAKGHYKENCDEAQKRFEEIDAAESEQRETERSRRAEEEAKRASEAAEKEIRDKIAREERAARFKAEQERKRQERMPVQEDPAEVAREMAEAANRRPISVVHSDSEISSDEDEFGFKSGKGAVSTDDMQDDAPIERGVEQSRAVTAASESMIRYRCATCKFRFKNEAYYAAHMIDHVPNNESMCRRCGQVLPTSLQFVLHESRCKWKRPMREHATMMAESDEEELESCEICGVEFEDPDAWPIHMAGHNI